MNVVTVVLLYLLVGAVVLVPYCWLCLRMAPWFKEWMLRGVARRHGLDQAETDDLLASTRWGWPYDRKTP